MATMNGMTTFAAAFVDDDEQTYTSKQTFPDVESALAHAEDVLDHPSDHAVLDETGRVVAATVLDPYQEPACIARGSA